MVYFFYLMYFMDAVIKRITGLSSMIGNTPLLAIDFKYKGENRTIYAKAENLNMTGSIKDRMALHIISNGYKTGKLKPGAEIPRGNILLSIAIIYMFN